MSQSHERIDNEEARRRLESGEPLEGARIERLHCSRRKVEAPVCITDCDIETLDLNKTCFASDVVVRRTKIGTLVLSDAESAAREYGFLRTAFQDINRFEDEDWAYYVSFGPNVATEDYGFSPAANRWIHALDTSLIAFSGAYADVRLEGRMQWLAMCEYLVGVVFLGLFVVAFSRKVIR